MHKLITMHTCSKSLHPILPVFIRFCSKVHDFIIVSNLYINQITRLCGKHAAAVCMHVGQIGSTMQLIQKTGSMVYYKSPPLQLHRLPARKVALKPVSPGSRKWSKILSKIQPSALAVSVESDGGTRFSECVFMNG